MRGEWTQAISLRIVDRSLSQVFDLPINPYELRFLQDGEPTQLKE